MFSVNKFHHQDNHHNFAPPIKSTRKDILYYLISFYIFSILLTTFEIPLIYRITNSIESIIWAYLLYFTWNILGILIFYFSKVTVKVSTLFRTSLILQIILCLYLILLFPSLTDSRILLFSFIIRGIITSMFALGYHISLMDIIEDKKRDGFMMTFFAIYTLLPVVIPAIGGAVIKYLDVHFLPDNNLIPHGYFVLFCGALLISLFSLILSPTINRTATFAINFKQLKRVMFIEKLKHAHRFLSLRSYVFTLKTVIYGLIIFVILEEEFSLGLYASVIALIGSIAFMIIGKIEKKYGIKRFSFFSIGLSGSVIGQLVLFFQTNFFGLVVKSFFDTIFNPIKNSFSGNMLRAKYDEVSEDSHIRKSNFIIFHEGWLYLPRILAFATLILLNRALDFDLNMLFKVSIIFIATLESFMFVFMKKVRIRKS